MSTERKLKKWIPAQQTQDGDGVSILRIAGRHMNQDLDPFLLIDELKASDEQDYIGGFPPHPHRGFETITYMLQGRVRHKDHMGNEGVVGPGDVQWMSAGRGVIHSEMPEKAEKMFHGFQLWLNLPADEKMKPAEYRDIRAAEILRHKTNENVDVLAVAGRVGVDGQVLEGPITGLSTSPVYLDVKLPAEAEVSFDIPQGHRALVYSYEGKIRGLPPSSLGVYEDQGERLTIAAGQGGASVLFLAGKPLKEPIVQHGPFVMNTQEQINEAINDYRQGTLVS